MVFFHRLVYWICMLVVCKFEVCIDLQAAFKGQGKTEMPLKKTDGRSPPQPMF